MPLFAATGAGGARPEIAGESGAVVWAGESEAGAKSAKSAHAPIAPVLAKDEILPCLRMHSPLDEAALFSPPAIAYIRGAGASRLWR